jgi:predicted transcriptional regulator with HTH domain
VVKERVELYLYNLYGPYGLYKGALYEHVQSDAESSRNALANDSVPYNVAPCRLVNGYRRSGGALYFLLQGQTFQEQTLLGLYDIKYSKPAKS